MTLIRPIWVVDDSGVFQAVPPLVCVLLELVKVDEQPDCKANHHDYKQRLVCAPGDVEEQPDCKANHPTRDYPPEKYMYIHSPMSGCRGVKVRSKTELLGEPMAAAASEEIT